MNTARDFGEYDVLAEAVWIAWRAEQRLTWQASRRWYDRALDALAASVVWLAAGALVLLAVAALLVCVALLLGAGWCVVLLAHALGW